MVPLENWLNEDEFVRMIQSIKISDNEKFVLLANWPNKELFKDRVIIIPASYVNTAGKRIKDHDCYGLGLSYKKIIERGL